MKQGEPNLHFILRYARKGALGGKVPLGVTGNTSDSGSEESWFEPRRGNSARFHLLRKPKLRHGKRETG